MRYEDDVIFYKNLIIHSRDKTIKNIFKLRPMTDIFSKRAVLFPLATKELSVHLVAGGSHSTSTSQGARP